MKLDSRLALPVYPIVQTSYKNKKDSTNTIQSLDLKNHDVPNNSRYRFGANGQKEHDTKKGKVSKSKFIHGFCLEKVWTFTRCISCTRDNWPQLQPHVKS